MSEIVEFLKARLDEDEADAREADGSRWLHEDKIVTFQFWNAEHGEMDWDTFVSTDTRANGYHIARHDPTRVLREVEAKRAFLAFHEQWPVLTETPPEFEAVDSGDINQMAYRMSQRMQWLTTQEYVARFGHEPPTAPMLLALAAVYADHPEYREEWRALIA